MPLGAERQGGSAPKRRPDPPGPAHGRLAGAAGGIFACFDDTFDADASLFRPLVWAQPHCRLGGSRSRFGRHSRRMAGPGLGGSAEGSGGRSGGIDRGHCLAIGGAVRGGDECLRDASVVGGRSLRKPSAEGLGSGPRARRLPRFGVARAGCGGIAPRSSDHLRPGRPLVAGTDRGTALGGRDRLGGGSRTRSRRVGVCADCFGVDLREPARRFRGGPKRVVARATGAWRGGAFGQTAGGRGR